MNHYDLKRGGLPDAVPEGERAADGLVVAVGGLDPGGGAGVVRDFLTARSCGAAGRMVVTAWADQSPHGVRAIEPREAQALEEAVRAETASRRRCAVKIGMIPNAEAARAVLAGLMSFEGPVVFDPVLAASSGGALFHGDLSALQPIVERATLVTPNADEAARFGGRDVSSVDAAVEAAKRMMDAGAKAVLVKGGHLPSNGRADAGAKVRTPAAGARDEVIDVFALPGTVRQLRSARLPVGKVRGTGCALASAIAVALSRGESLDRAVDFGRGWLTSHLAAPVHVGDEWHLAE